MDLAFFDLVAPRSGTETLDPRDSAVSTWDPGQLRGPAVSGALARAADRVRTGSDLDPLLLPARWSVDLHFPARFEPSQTRGRVVRRGRRLTLIDVDLLQRDTVVARGTLLLLRRGDVEPGHVWSPPPRETFAVPDDLAQAWMRRLYFSEPTGWSTSSHDLDTTERKEVAVGPVPIVHGEEPSPFVFAATTADLTNLAAHWGSRGVEYINTDVTLHLVRLPEGEVIGISTTDQLEHEGLAAASADLWDSRGRFAIASITGLGNAGRSVDPTVALGGDPG